MDADLPQVQKLIDQRFEGIVLESAVQGWVYLEEYRRGLAAYQAINKPTPKDQRWAGVCYLMLHQREEAEQLLYRAVTRGEEGARIELARVLGFMDRSEKAAAELAKVDAAKLNPPDRVLLLRAQSYHQENSGNFQQAVELAEEGWRLVQGLPEYPVLAPWLLIRLGLLYGQIGRVQRALWCFDQALEIVPKAPASLMLAKAHGLLMLGRYTQAIQELAALQADYATGVRGLYLGMKADIAWAMGNTPDAAAHYLEVIPLLLEVDSQGELTCRLSLAALYGGQGVYPTALEHLARARVLVNYRRDRLDYRFHEVLLDYWRGALPATDAQQALATLVEEYGAMGLLQEQGRVQVHLAEIYRAAGDGRYLDELDRLQALCAVLQNQAFLAREWVLAPQLREAARLSHPKLVGGPPQVLELYSMGEEKIVLGGQTVNIRLRRAVELLAYFLEHREVGLKKLMADIFPDDKPKSARIYFHQFRHELLERLPGVTIDYQAQTRSYRLVSDYDIMWDVAELRAGRRMGELGIFLPGCGNEWAHLLDEALEPLRNAPEAPINVKRTQH
ncbi:MAG: hypothetical protein KGZ60_02190 [Truepera sp.]|nr:hypothetical protein [Truepera sp.]